MRTIDPSTPLINCTIQGLTFTIGQPFKAGQTIDEREAGALNQLLIENCRNNYASVVDDLVEEKGFETAGQLSDDDKAKLQVEFMAYVQKYEFGTRRGGQRFSDPVMRQARVIGKAAVKKALVNHGYKTADITTEMVNDNLAKYWPEFSAKWLDQARVMVEVAKKAESDIPVIPRPDQAAA